MSFAVAVMLEGVNVVGIVSAVTVRVPPITGSLATEPSQDGVAGCLQHNMATSHVLWGIITT